MGTEPQTRRGGYVEPLTQGRNREGHEIKKAPQMRGLRVRMRGLEPPRDFTPTRT